MDPPFLTRWAAEWGFDDSLQGWTPNGAPPISFTSGRVALTDTGGDPYLVSPDGLNLDATHSLVYVGLRNPGASPEASLFFIPSTSGPSDFSAGRSVSVPTIANDASTREYVIDLSTHPEWRGTTRRIRFDPGTIAGTYTIDYVRVGSPFNRSLAPVWEFATDAERWTPRNGALSASGGALTLAVTGDDAGMELTGLSVSASRTKVRLRVRNGLSETSGEVFFATSAAPTFAASRAVPFALVASDGVRREYVADMSRNLEWAGTVTALRVDFGAMARGNVEIDWIGVDE